MMKKRWIAILLVMAMVLSCLPVSILAEEITGTGQNTEDINLTTTKEENPEKPVLTGGRTSKNGESDGKITGLDPTKSYEYSDDDMKNWKSVPSGSSEITGLKSGYYYVRLAETDQYKPSQWVLCKVYERFDVTVETIDGGGHQAQINGKAACVYVAKQSLDVIHTYFGKANVYATIGVHLTGGVIDLISGNFNKTEKDDALYNEIKGIHDAIDGLHEDLQNISNQIGDESKDIIDAVKNTEKNVPFNEISNKCKNMEAKYYSGADEAAIARLAQFYNGEMTDDDNSYLNKQIDNTLHHFYAANSNKELKVSSMTNKDYLDTQTLGRDFYTDFIDLGISLCNVDENKKDIFTLYKEIQSYKAVFNAETFENRELFNNNTYNFYEKGYALLGSAIAYELNNHQNILAEIDALEKKKDTLEKDSEDYKAIDAELSQIVADTKKQYHGEAEYNLKDVKDLHQSIIDADQADLTTLNKQYEAVKTAKEKAMETLNKEKKEYEEQHLIYCYRTNKFYNSTLHYESVNHDYIVRGLETEYDIEKYFDITINEIRYKKKFYDDFINLYCIKSNSLKNSDLLSNTSDSNLKDSVFNYSVSRDEINQLTIGCKNRDTTIEEQFQKYFNVQYPDVVFTKINSCTLIRQYGKSVESYKDYINNGSSGLFGEKYKGLYVSGKNIYAKTQMGGDVVLYSDEWDGSKKFSGIINEDQKLQRKVVYKDTTSTDVSDKGFTEYTTRYFEWRTEAVNDDNYRNASNRPGFKNYNYDYVMVLNYGGLGDGDDESTVLSNFVNPSTGSSGYNGTLFLAVLFSIAALVGIAYFIGKRKESVC